MVQKSNKVRKKNMLISKRGMRKEGTKTKRGGKKHEKNMRQLCVQTCTKVLLLDYMYVYTHLY